MVQGTFRGRLRSPSAYQIAERPITLHALSAEREHQLGDDGDRSLHPRDHEGSQVMKRNMIGGLAILAVVAVAGWRLANHRETSTGLRDISLIQGSEHSQPGPTDALAGIRIRLSPSDYDDQIRATAHEIPQIALAAK
jgi:hypothetical protein